MYRNIMIAVSLDDERDLAPAVQAARLLASDDAQFHFVHVLEILPVYVTEAMPPEILSDRADAARERLEEVSEGIENAHKVLLDGTAGRTLTGWARENDIDCIVISSHRPVMSDIFLGSTAAWVVRHADCSVHVLR